MTVPDTSAARLSGGSAAAAASPTSVVRLDGPWTHRDVAANGTRLDRTDPPRRVYKKLRSVSSI